MLSYEHNPLDEHVARLDDLPEYPAEYADCVEDGSHLQMLSDNVDRGPVPN